MIEKAKQYAIKCHSGTNHLYNGMPYSVHLEMVVDVANKFIHLIPEEHRENVLAACWTHDVIEDCRETYNDVKNATNIEVAELTYALTNEKGRTRKDRGNTSYYSGIRNTPFATFIKLCDRIANYEYSKKSGSRMAKMYENEMPEFIARLSCLEYAPMSSYLLNIGGVSLEDISETAKSHIADYYELSKNL